MAGVYSGSLGVDSDFHRNIHTVTDFQACKEVSPWLLRPGPACTRALRSRRLPQSPARMVDRYSYPSVPSLYEQSLKRNESHLAVTGPLVVETGIHTGRSARDKFLVDDGTTHDSVWWGDINHRMSPEHFATLQVDVLTHLEDPAHDHDRSSSWGGSSLRHSGPVDDRARMGRAFCPQSLPATERRGVARAVPDPARADLRRRSRRAWHPFEHGDRDLLLDADRHHCRDPLCG